jgi:hypothetical protein
MIAVSIGGLTLAEDLFAIELGIDQLVLRETRPQRLSCILAVCPPPRPSICYSLDRHYSP